MQAIEFETELHGEKELALPISVQEKLPKDGRARVILLIEDDVDEGAFRRAAYESFLRDDSKEDSVYDDIS